MTKFLKLSVLGLVALFTTGARAADPADPNFYRNKTVQFYIAYAAGGGFDLYARLAARHLGTMLEGRPAMVPLNNPGGGGILLANKMYFSLPRDGTAIGMTGESVYSDQLLGVSGADYDAAQFGWVGRLNDLPLLVVSWHTSPISQPKDMLTKPFAVAVPGASSSAAIGLAVISKLFGTQYKVISGYQSGNETRLAMERGEVDATASMSWASLRDNQPEWLTQKKVNLLMQLALRKVPDLPQVPVITEFARNDSDRAILELVMMSAEVGRTIVTPPGLPPDRLAMLRNAFDRMVKDESFLADAKKSNLEINPLSGAEMHTLILRLSKTPPELLEQTRTIVRAAKEAK